MMDVLSEVSRLSHNSHLSEMFKGAVHPVKSSTPACASGFVLRELTSLCNFDIPLLRFLAYCTYLVQPFAFYYLTIDLYTCLSPPVDCTFLEGKDLSQTSLRSGVVPSGCLADICLHAGSEGQCKVKLKFSRDITLAWSKLIG